MDLPTIDSRHEFGCPARRGDGPCDEAVNPESLFDALAQECRHDHFDLESYVFADGPTFVCTDCDHRVLLVSPTFDSAWFEVLGPAARANVEDYGARKVAA